MRVSHFAVVLLVHFLILSELCSGDKNIETGFNCPESNESAAEPTFRADLRRLLDSLVANAPLKRGFHKAEAGEKHERLYGLVQCRGDVSAVDCSSCAEGSARAALEKCPKSKDVSVWFRWCFLRYSDEEFFGAMDQTSISRTNDTDFDDLSVVSKGQELMNGLALTVQKQDLMFETAVVDVGPGLKRYGMAQCNRDIDRAECGKCLQSQLADFKTTVWNKRGWEVYGLSCSMWYHDYQFYFNASADTSKGVMMRLSSSDKGVPVRVMIVIFTLVVTVL